MKKNDRDNLNRFRGFADRGDGEGGRGGGGDNVKSGAIYPCIVAEAGKGYVGTAYASNASDS